MAITTQDQLLAKIAEAGQKPFAKQGATGKGAGSYHSYWAQGGLPGAGAAQGSVNGAVPDDATAGAILFNNPAAPALTYLARLGLALSPGNGMFELYDRLWHNSGLSGVVATAQAIAQPALTRSADGVGVELYAEWYAPTGATAVNATASYTNTDNVAGRLATAAFPASPVAGQMVPFNLAAGDRGIRSVQSLTLSATTGTAGNFGLTLFKNVVEVPSGANVGQSFDAYDLGLPQIPNDACLAMMVLLNQTAVPSVNGSFVLAQG